jgi:hypothetical protein
LRKSLEARGTNIKPGQDDGSEIGLTFRWSEPFDKPVLSEVEGLRAAQLKNVRL